MTLTTQDIGFLTLKEIIDVQRVHQLLSSDDENEVTLERLERKLLRGNVVALDLRLGSEVFLSSNEFPKKLDVYNEYVSIKPGEFALLTTYEKLDMPKNILAFISMRFQYKRKGLVNISGFHIDPAYKGRITYSVYNAGPHQIMLKFKDEVFTVIFARIATETDERQYSTFQNVNNLKTDGVSELVGDPLSLRSLEQRIHKLETILKAIGYGTPIIIGIILALFGLSQAPAIFQTPGG